MKNKRFLQAFIGAVAVLALGVMMLFPLGCSKLLPTAPGEDLVQGYTAEQLWPKPPASLVGWPEPCSAESSGWFGPNGGVLNLQAKCFDLDFDVEPGALTEEVFISVTATLFNYCQNEEVQKGLHFDFGPDGLVFYKPAEIELEASVLEAENGEVLKLYLLNPETGLWYIEQEVVMEDATLKLEFEVSHFSRYAISR